LISGLFLIGEGSFEVGDTIQITLIRGNTIEGEVISIDLLSVKLLTLDNVYIRLPKRTTYSCACTQLVKISDTTYSNYARN
jgi:small-conductance mechanosensitive channel